MITIEKKEKNSKGLSAALIEVETEASKNTIIFIKLKRNPLKLNLNNSYIFYNSILFLFTSVYPRDDTINQKGGAT